MFYKAQKAKSKDDILIAQEVPDIDHPKKIISNVYLSMDETVGQHTLITSNLFRNVPLVKNKETNLISYFIAGCAGSGKSYYVADIVNRLKSLPKFKNATIYLISGQTSLDPVFESSWKSYITININHPDFGLLKWDEFANPKGTIVIFDDVDSISNKELGKFINNLQNGLLQNGRKSNIASFNISHALRDYRKTKYLHQECCCHVLFPNSDYILVGDYLKDKFKLREPMINHILDDLDTRSITLYRHHPQFLVSDHEIYLLRPEKSRKK